MLGCQHTDNRQRDENNNQNDRTHKKPALDPALGAEDRVRLSEDTAQATAFHLEEDGRNQRDGYHYLNDI